MGMLQTTARLLGKKRLIRSVPFFSLGLSKLWVAVFSDSSMTFVSPLIESLRHRMTVEEHPLIRKMGINCLTFEEAVKFTIAHKNDVPKLPSSKPIQKLENTVRSVQRLPNPNNKSADWVAKEYLRWLPASFSYLMKIEEQGNVLSFQLFGMTLLKLELIESRSNKDRTLFYIIGGLLAKRTDYGWLEFRSVLDGKYVVAAIHEFVPRLPWFIYVNSQALIHLWVMRRFGRHLGRR